MKQTVVRFLCFLVVVYCQTKTPIKYEIGQKEIKDLLDAHNNARRNENSSDMNILRWDDALARTATAWASKCIYDHEFNIPKSSYLSIGQNIDATAPAQTNINYFNVVKSWMKESNYYNYDNHKCSAICGHYTQVVWSTTSSVGCGSYMCPVLQKTKWKNATYVVCNYGPAGNIPNEFPYEKGEPCDSCPLGCTDSLCEPVDWN